MDMIIIISVGLVEYGRRWSPIIDDNYFYVINLFTRTAFVTTNIVKKMQGKFLSTITGCCVQKHTMDDKQLWLYRVKYSLLKSSFCLNL